jgi:ribosomal peptide maturation radical SAM protein 1
MTIGECPRVALVNMPFGSMMRPSLALGLLKAHLARLGIRAQVIDFTRPFADAIGADSYLYLSDQCPPEELGGDFVFAGCLFGDDPARTDAYLASITGGQAAVDVLVRARSHAQAFLKGCLDSVDWGSYDVVGFTTTFCQNLAALALARLIKERHPAAFVVFGGANCEGVMGLALHRCFPFIDAVCTGEADLTFPRLVERLGNPAALDALAGLVLRRGAMSHARSLAPERVRDLDDLPYPDFDDVCPVDERPERRVLVMETSRGCWWGDRHHCTFCGMDFSYRYRSKSTGRALAELIALRDRYAATHFVMTDDILDLRYFREFIPGLAQLQPPVSLFYETKANLTRDQVAALGRAGVRQLQPGIESFSSAALRLMDKGVSAAQNVQLLKWCEEEGIEPRWNLLYGLPGDSGVDYDGMSETVALLGHLHPPGGYGPIRLDRFSPYFLDPVRFGIANVEPCRAYGLLYDLPEPRLREIAYYFRFDYPDGGDTEGATKRLRDAIDDWRANYVPGMLRYEDDGRRLRILDRRSGSLSTSTLEGWQRVVYLGADSHRSSSYLVNIATSSGASQADAEAFLHRLVATRLMLQIEGRYVSLAVRASVYE